jgi:hypothetical protein
MIDLLDYGVQLSLLRRVEGRYSFYHPRLLEFFKGGGPSLADLSPRVTPAKRGFRRLIFGE